MDSQCNDGLSRRVQADVALKARVRVWRLAGGSGGGHAGRSFKLFRARSTAFLHFCHFLIFFLFLIIIRVLAAATQLTAAATH